MSSLTVSDLIDQASLTRDTSGLKVVRKFLVEGLTEVASKRLFEAAELAAIPKVGNAHPTIPGQVASSINVVPCGDGTNTKVWVIVQYESPSFENQEPSETAVPTIEGGATLSSIDTSVDKNNAEMTLAHTGLPNQPGKASIQEPNPYITFGRKEPSPFNYAKVKTFSGTVNSTTWFGDPARTWLCSAIRFSLSGDAFDVSYEFQYRSKTWDVELVFTDATTGAPVVGAVQGTGIKKFRIYSEQDFNSLNLGV